MITRSFMKKLATVSVLGLAFSLLGDKPAAALTATDNLAVSATVTSSCTIVAAPVNFGTYDVASGTANDASGSVTITCTNGAPVYVTLGQGSNAGAGSTDAAPVRQMSAGGTDRLGYGLFRDAARTTAWGNTQATGSAQTGSGAAQVLTVFGRIPALQGVASGAYTDSVLATVNY
jgi:spore coat protein U-like protein